MFLSLLVCMLVVTLLPKLLFMFFSFPCSPQVPISTVAVNPVAAAIPPTTDPTADPAKPLFPSAAPQVMLHAANKYCMYMLLYLTIQTAGEGSSNGDGVKPTFPAYQQLEGANNPNMQRVPATGPGTKLMHPEEDVSMVGVVSLEPVTVHLTFHQIVL